MICKHITKRSYQRQSYLYCRKLKKEITWEDCKNCLEIEPRENKPIKKKSSKLAKLENNRFSILTDDLEHCYICKRIFQKIIPKDDLHEIFGGRNRKISMKMGFVAPVCRKHHEDKNAKEYLKKVCFIKARKKYSAEELNKLLM